MQGQLSQKITMLRRWGRILGGGTAVAIEQGRGRASKPGQLLGYWNDLTGKVSADTLLDSENVPLSVIAGGERCHFPIAIFQYALGCNDLYLINGQERYLDAIRTCADWAIANQRENGSWDAFGPIGSARYTVSSMAQGEGASLLLRASYLLDNASYAEFAKGAIDFMLLSLLEGGTAVYEDEALFLEEYPQTPRRSVMNGWIFSLFGLYDILLVDPSYTEVFELSTQTLVNHLSDYDAGYWTYYDLEHRIASPAYHKLHIAQLQELGEISGMSEFTVFAEKLESYQSNDLKRAKAIIRKLGQKITEKSDAVILQ